MEINEISEQLAKLVHYHRKQTGLSQEQLATYAGVGKTVVFDIEHAKPTVKLSTVISILKVLNIEIEFNSPLMKQMAESDAKS